MTQNATDLIESDTALKAARSLLWYQAMGVDSAMAATPPSRMWKDQAPEPVILTQTAPIAKQEKRTAPAPSLGRIQAEQDARKIVSAVKTLAELQKVVEDFPHPLKVTATNCVFADGNPQAKIMIIGEGAGADEDAQGKPFVGVSGQMLRQMLSYAGLKSSEDYYLTNIIHWRPPGNREATEEELAISLPFVQKQIELVAPQYLLLAGGVAAKALLQQSANITKIRGQWFDYIYQTAANETKTIQAMPIFHPAYLLRQPLQRRLAWRDLLAVKSKIQ